MQDIYNIYIFAFFFLFVCNHIGVYYDLISLTSIINVNDPSSEQIWTSLTFWNVIYFVSLEHVGVVDVTSFNNLNALTFSKSFKFHYTA